MEKGLLHLHSIMRYVIILLSIYAIYKAYVGYTQKQVFNTSHQKANLFLMIAAHITLLIGLYQWFTGPWGLKAIQASGMGEIMKNPTVEHFVGMLVAILLITLANRVSKSTKADVAKFKTILTYQVIALVLIVASIPWPFRTALGRGWFPQ
jgi:hypothetical protein